MTTLFDFILDLSTQPRLQRAFRADPDGTLRDAGLSERSREVVKTADKRRLDAALLEEADGGR